MTFRVRAVSRMLSIRCCGDCVGLSRNLAVFGAEGKDDEAPREVDIAVETARDSKIQGYNVVTES